MVSEALGVTKRQIPAALELAAKKGVTVRFDSEGRAIFNSAKERKQYAEAHGFYDRDGGYGDPQRGASGKYR